ncbi:kelch-like protein 21 isoform X1 [Amphiura filiformis]|uniref:kelch-like protein 21 isoform X1 n=2 Tax=Amphiura filiformis TaxID=82378 RepID=UPI003B22826D
MRLSNELTDVVLTAGGRDFACHKTVLAAGSPYFKAMFTGSLQENELHRVTLKEVDPVMLGCVIDYLYTSHIQITTDNVQDLLIASDFFLLKCLVHACTDFLKRQLHVDNCVEIHKFAEERGCPELTHAALRFVLRNFADVSRTDGFLQCSADDIKIYVSHDNLQIASEKALYNMLQRWLNFDLVNRKAKFPELLKLVRLVYCPFDKLLDIQREPTVQSCQECIEVVKLARNCLNDVEVKPREWIKPRKSTNLANMLVVLGGVQADRTVHRSSLLTYCCDPKEGFMHWSKLAVMPYSLNSAVMYDVASLANDIYVTGGYEGSVGGGAIASVWRYDTQKDTWDGENSLQCARYKHASAVMKGKLYILGGFDGTHKLNHMEVFDPDKKEWTTKEPMIEPVAFPTATAWNEKLYVIGGLKEDDSIYEWMQCYDLQSESWSVIKTLQIQTKGCLSVLLNDLIYLVGGRTKDVHVYDPAADKTLQVAPLNCIHMCTGITVMEGKIYIIGGDNLKDRSWDVVECYDPSTNTWTEEGNMPLSLYWHGVVSLVKDVRLLEWPRDWPKDMSAGPFMLYRGYGERDVSFDPR